MGFRFRKSFKLAKGVRMTVSKSGISTRIGGKGFSVSSGKRGTRMNVGIPGTGISYSAKLFGGPSSKRGSKSSAAPTREYHKDKFTTFILCLLLGYFGVHWFYLGQKGKGILYLCTIGLFGVGWIFDTIRLYIGLFIDKNKEYTDEEKSAKLKQMGIVTGGIAVFIIIAIAFSQANPNVSKSAEPVMTETTESLSETSSQYIFNYDFSKPDAEYFTYNATIDDFIIDYNEIAEFPVVAGEVERGNINSKAFLDLNNCYIVVISSKNLEIRIDAYNNNDLYNAMPIVTDMIKVVDPDINSDQIKLLFENGTAIEFANGKASKIGSNFDLSLDYKGLTE